MSILSRRSKIQVEGVPGVVNRARVTLTSAQILALSTTPIQILPAGGTGAYISIDEILVKGPATGSTPYTGANALEIRYTDGSGVKLTGDAAAALINSASGRVDKVVGAAGTAVANAAVVAVVPTANPAAGTGTITLDIVYRVIGL